MGDRKGIWPVTTSATNIPKEVFWNKWKKQTNDNRLRSPGKM